MMLMSLDYWSHFDSKNKERGKEEKKTKTGTGLPIRRLRQSSWMKVMAVCTGMVTEAGTLGHFKSRDDRYVHL